MIRLITKDDLIDVKHKLKQRGLNFLLSKFNFNDTKRTKSAFNTLDYNSADWWIIEKVRQRWNKLITGDKNTEYEAYMMNDFFKQTRNLKVLSLGSGDCYHELNLAQYDNFTEIVCVDLSEKILNKAKLNAEKLRVKNMKFVVGDFYSIDFPDNYFDIVFFNSSLHHVKNVSNYLKFKVQCVLKSSGYLVINEYVGPSRLQFPKNQINTINLALKRIPTQYKTRYKSEILKTKFYGSGYIRVYIADPSECVDSASILKAIHENFSVVIEKPYGGNILMNVLKDISHHFVELNDKKITILNHLFKIEDDFLTNNPSDFIFGIYKNK